MAMRPKRKSSALATLAATLLPLSARAGSFVFPDFNDTQGIIFNRDAGTTSCVLLEVR